MDQMLNLAPNSKPHARSFGALSHTADVSVGWVAPYDVAYLTVVSRDGLREFYPDAEIGETARYMTLGV